MALLKQCSWHGCTKIIADGVMYCPYHQKKWDKENKERYKVYKTVRLMDAERKKFDKFYKSKDWIRIRDSIISGCYGMCLVCWARGKIINMNTCHHIQKLDKCWDSRLDKKNLICVCASCHQRIHVEYNKGDREEKAMQKVLLGLLDKFNEEFGI